MSVCSFNDKYGGWSCHPVLVIRCDRFLLWNFGPSQVHTREAEDSGSEAVTRVKNSEAAGQYVQAPADDDHHEYRAPLNGGCAAEAWCTTHVDL